MSARLLLVRHGVTTWNREGRFQGHRDPPLADEGREEGRLLAARLAAHAADRPSRVLSSPLRRARETAELLANGAEVQEDRRLIEIGQGEWEGRTHRELRETDLERYAAWRAEAGRAVPPGGEPLEQALSRVAAAVEAALDDSRWPLCVVSHGGILRLLAGHLLGLSHGRAWAMDLANASLSVLEWDARGWRIQRWNDVAHILGARTAALRDTEDAADRSEEGEALSL